MKIDVLRYSDNGDSTLSLFMVNDKFFCYALEDEHRDEKVKGETRIPDGTYNVSFLAEDTPLTRHYQNTYPFFQYHIWIQDVPNFSNVYIHIGNFDEDTDGCILLGNTANNNRKEKGMVGSSRKAYEEFYSLFQKAVYDGEENTISIKSIYK